MTRSYESGKYCHPIGILALAIGIPLAASLYSPAFTPRDLDPDLFDRTNQFEPDGGSIMAYKKPDSGIYIASSTNALGLYTTH